MTCRPVNVMTVLSVILCVTACVLWARAGTGPAGEPAGWRASGERLKKQPSEL
jgi:hypothetical protein